MKSARELASDREWVRVGRDQSRVVWGECQGSGKLPYQTEVDLSEPAFKCTCPSRKFPCKHGLGLLLLFCTEPAVFAEQEPPGWVTDWIIKRDKAAEKKATKTEQEAEKDSPAPDPAQQVKKEASKRKRVLDRHAKVASGVAELDVWLRDLVRQGFAAAQQFPAGYWDGMAARMIDAQAPGLGRMLRDLSSIPGSGDGWPERMLSRLGSLCLLAEGFRRIEALEAEAQADIRAAIGWTQKEEELTLAEGVLDNWAILGHRIIVEDRLKTRRTWLTGQTSGRRALVLDFAFGREPLPVALAPGTKVEAELVFYPGAYPLRAIVKNRTGPSSREWLIPGFNSVEEFANEYACALSLNPWLEAFPCALESVVPVGRSGSWFLRDAAGLLAPISPSFGKAWELAAASGGRPLSVFGEWDGRCLLPLSAGFDGRFIRFLMEN